MQSIALVETKGCSAMTMQYQSPTGSEPEGGRWLTFQTKCFTVWTEESMEKRSSNSKVMDFNDLQCRQVEIILFDLL